MNAAKVYVVKSRRNKLFLGFDGESRHLGRLSPETLLLTLEEAEQEAQSTEDLVPLEAQLVVGPVH